MIKSAIHPFGKETTLDHIGESSETMQPSDSLVPTKFTHEEFSEPYINYEGGMISPLSETDGVYMSAADDGKEKVKVNVLSNKKSHNFICDVASSYRDKVVGLQSYSSLNNDNGLLFTYDYPQDVLYHMGTVSFPIDIIFADENLSIRKIVSDIQPGSLATFGCSKTKYVLEVNAGVSKSLGISEGAILSFENLGMVKSASEKQRKMTYVFYMDDLYSSEINISKVSSFDNDKIFLDLDNSAYFEKESKVIRADEFIKYATDYKIKNSYDNLSKIALKINDSKKVYSYLKQAHELGIKIIVATKHPEISNLGFSALQKAYGYIGDIKFDTYKVASFNYIDTIDNIRDLYPTSDVMLFSTTLRNVKIAGEKVSETVKNEAKKALEFLKIVDDNISLSLDNINKNLNEYSEFMSTGGDIAATKGQYFQSVKRNIEVVKKYLTATRDAINILTEIKDATTTEEIIDSLATSAEAASDSIQGIFDLVNSIDMEDFITELDLKTKSYEQVINDYISNVKTARDYINKEILGIIVLSA